MSNYLKMNSYHFQCQATFWWWPRICGRGRDRTGERCWRSLYRADRVASIGWELSDRARTRPTLRSTRRGFARNQCPVNNDETRVYHWHDYILPIQKIRQNSSIQKIRQNSLIQKIRQNSLIQKIWQNGQVRQFKLMHLVKQTFTWAAGNL